MSENRYTKKLAEVLSPAGSFDTFKAVINAGADAVYLAGQCFGARAYAGNLSDAELLAAIDYAHIRDRKMYLTVNTLLKNNEIFSSLYSYIRPLYEAGLDAVIVQDYGVMKFITDNFPDMDIHASTQMTITYAGYMDFLKKYNVTRIVPARELSLEEIKILSDYSLSMEKPMEIECFVHGALCYAYSGQCLMSSFYGGRSGNRGRCAGTCRLDFCKDNQNLAWLSLKDLNTIEILPQIIDAGVYSLKIEGRMKSTEYAAGITSIYRKYVDMIEAGQPYIVDSADLSNLLNLFDRGGNTKGYYIMHNGKTMLADENKTEKSIEEKNLYEKSILSKYANYDLKHNVNISASFLRGNEASITIYDDTYCVTAYADIVENADRLSMTEENIKKQITKLGQTDFVAQNVDVEVDDNIFIPNRLLNELRRKACLDFYNTKLSRFRRTADTEKKYTFTKADNHAFVTAQITNYNQARAAVEAGSIRIYIDTELIDYDEISLIRELCKENGVEAFLCMPRIIRNNYFSFIDKNIDLIKKMNFDGFLIRNMAELPIVKKHFCDKMIISDYTIYAFNNLDVSVLSENFDGITLPVELNSGELKHIYGQNTELIVYMRQPLMVSAGCIDCNSKGCHKPNPRVDYIRDRKNASLKYVTSCKYCYNVIYNSVPTYIADKENEISDISPASVRYVFLDESAQEVKAVMSGNIENYTRGHFTKGVE